MAPTIKKPKESTGESFVFIPSALELTAKFESSEKAKQTKSNSLLSAFMHAAYAICHLRENGSWTFGDIIFECRHFDYIPSLLEPYFLRWVAALKKAGRVEEITIVGVHLTPYYKFI